jgi:hypothetical protein
LRSYFDILLSQFDFIHCARVIERAFGTLYIYIKVNPSIPKTSLMVTRPGTTMLRSPKDILNVRYNGKV